MKKVTISVTEAARNFSDCVNRARYQNITFVLLKNGLPVAQLVPETTRVCRGHDLAQAVETPGLSNAEAKAWYRDLKSARKAIKAPVDKWR